MTVYDDILAELRAIRGLLERSGITPSLQSYARAFPQQRLPWDCGHWHPTRGEAVACKKAALTTADDGA